MVEPVRYLIWAKRHRRARYELTISGMNPASMEDFGADARNVDLRVVGDYGHPRLIELLAERYGVDPLGVVPVPGASSAIFVALGALADRSRPLVMERPVYEPVVRVARFLRLPIIWLDRKPEQNYAVDDGQIQRLLKGGAGGVFLTNAHNPSGQIVDRAAMAAIASQCQKYDARLFVDEVYLDFPHVNLGTPCWTAAGLPGPVAAMNSLTKVYGLGGLRMGWILTTPALARHLRRFMDHLSVENSAPSSSLAVRAMENLHRLEARTRTLYERNSPILRQWLADHSELTGYANHGTVFQWVRLPEGLKSGPFCVELYRKHDTRVVPGEFFGCPDHVRVSMATTLEDLRGGLSRFSQLLRSKSGTRA